MDLRHRSAPLDPRIGPMTVSTAAGERRSSARSAVSSGWRTALLSIGLAALVFGIVFREDLLAAIRVWIDSTAYNHCFLILPLAGFLIWERRAALRETRPRAALWPVALMLPLSAVWFVAAVLDVHEGRQLAMVAMFEIVLLAVLGPQLFRRLLAPLLFLFFLVPTGAFLVPALQRITADITVAGLHALRIPVFSDGNMIEIPEGTFEIAEACAGLRFLVASSVFGCFFAVLMYRSRLRRALFIALSVAVPIGANGLRALGIIVLAHLEGSATAVEADHVLYGWLFFSLVTLVLIAIGMTFTDGAARRPEASGPAPIPRPAIPLWRSAAIAVAAVALALSGPAYAARLDSAAPATGFSGVAGPKVSGGWRPVPAASAVWRPLVSGEDRQFLDGFEEPGSGVVIRYLALYRLRAVGNRLTNSENRIVDDRSWQLAQRGVAEAVLHGRKVAVTSSQIVHQPYRRLVWSFYVVDGEIAAGPLQAKLLQARAALFGRASVAAFVAVSASMDDPRRGAADQITDFLSASQPFAQYLEALRRSAKPSG